MRSLRRSCQTILASLAFLAAVFTLVAVSQHSQYTTLQQTPIRPGKSNVRRALELGGEVSEFTEPSTIRRSSRPEAQHKITVSKPGDSPAREPSNAAQDTLVRDFRQLKAQLRLAERRSESSGATADLGGAAGPPGDGIVIAAGKALRLANVWVVLRVLRQELHSSLPVEIWHMGPEELDDRTKAHLEGTFLNVRCIDALQVEQPFHHGKPASLASYALKAFALYSTTFDRALLLDSDCLPIVDPALLFDSPEFREYGNLLWPDLFGKGTEMVPGMQPQLYGLFGLQLPWAGREDSFMWAESGQVFFDRVRHKDVLEYLWFLNAHRDPVYKLAYGDKDTFLLAFLLAGKGRLYFQVEEHVRLCVHELPERPGAKLEHVGILHHDPLGSITFLHRTAGGKFDPHQDAYLRADMITVPLDPRRAWVLFDGAGEPTNYRYSRDRFLPFNASSAASPAGGFKVCLKPDALAGRHNCTSDSRVDLPVPVITSSQLADPQYGDAAFANALKASYAAFEELRYQLRQPNNTVMTGIAWLR